MFDPLSRFTKTFTISLLIFLISSQAFAHNGDISFLAAQNTSDNNTTFGANDSSIAVSAAVQVNSSVNSRDQSGKSEVKL